VFSTFQDIECLLVYLPANAVLVISAVVLKNMGCILASPYPWS
jgi:hypothetical protein